MYHHKKHTRAYYISYEKAGRRLASRHVSFAFRVFFSRGLLGFFVVPPRQCHRRRYFVVSVRRFGKRLREDDREEFKDFVAPLLLELFDDDEAAARTACENVHDAIFVREDDDGKRGRRRREEKRREEKEKRKEICEIGRRRGG